MKLWSDEVKFSNCSSSGPRPQSWQFDFQSILEPFFVLIGLFLTLIGPNSLPIVQFSIQSYQIRGIWGRWVVLNHLRVSKRSTWTKNRYRTSFPVVQNQLLSDFLSSADLILFLIVKFSIQRYQTRGIWGHRFVIDHSQVPTSPNWTNNRS